MCCEQVFWRLKYRLMSDYNIAYYQHINAEEGPQAQRLADVMVWKYAPSSVIDVGCASGLYLKPFLEKGIKVTGIDSAKAAIADEILQIPRSYIQLSDITKQAPKTKADLALCIEVMEHIPARYAQRAIGNLVKAADSILFTAAQPGQGGLGHVNCQLPTYWEALFAKNGFKRKFEDEEYLKIIMAAGYHMGWLTNNLMVLEKNI